MLKWLLLGTYYIKPTSVNWDFVENPQIEEFFYISFPSLIIMRIIRNPWGLQIFFFLTSHFKTKSEHLLYFLIPHTRQEQDNGKLWAPLEIFQWGFPLKLLSVSVEIHYDYRKDFRTEEGGVKKEGKGLMTKFKTNIHLKTKKNKNINIEAGYDVKCSEKKKKHDYTFKSIVRLNDSFVSVKVSRFSKGAFHIFPKCPDSELITLQYSLFR